LALNESTFICLVKKSIIFAPVFKQSLVRRLADYIANIN
jgi:hypothetical protein